jgi:hypothetical protein
LLASVVVYLEAAFVRNGRYSDALAATAAIVFRSGDPDDHAGQRAAWSSVWRSSMMYLNPHLLTRSNLADRPVI